MTLKRKNALVIVGASLLASQGAFAFGHDFVIGTSLDLRLTAVDGAAAEAAHAAVLSEIDRLEGILSGYVAHGELARINAGERFAVSRELVEVLALYEGWREMTGGRISPSMEALKQMWREAGVTGNLPDAGCVLEGVSEARERLWSIADGVMSADVPLNIDALGKAYVAQRAAEVARGMPGIMGGVLDIGGDLVTWGTDAGGRAWRIGVADPMNPAENALPLTVIEVNEAAIATSGSYARGSEIGGAWRSHIMDPRTGEPAPEIVSATVVARDLVSANALATAMNVGTAAEARELGARFEDVSALVVDKAGRADRTGVFVSTAGPIPPTAAATQPADPAAAKWPAGYQVTVNFTLAASRRPEREYMALWIEDADGKFVRTVEVWGRQAKYLRDLRTWWRWGKDDAQMVQSVTRASRVAGQYSLVWDGLDQNGKGVAPGTYTMWMEVVSEHGPRGASSGKIVCGATKATGAIDATAAFGSVTLSYAPKEKAK